MDRFWLDVPYASKEKAKALGARWDPERQRWHAPAGSDVAAALSWRAAEPPRVETRPGVIWNELPPRTENPEVLLALLNPTKVVRRDAFFCGMCDSDRGEEWLIFTDSPLVPAGFCVCHPGSIDILCRLEVGLLRPSEGRLLRVALEDGRLDGFLRCRGML
jgi:hypothetical protein